MTIATIRGALKTALDTVTDVGVTHDYERWSNEYDNVLDFYDTTISGTQQLRGWEIGYRGFDSIPPDQPISMGRARHHRAHRFVVKGYLGVDDSAATEKTSANLAEDVCDAFDSDSTLHSSTYYRTSEAQIQLFEPRVHAGVLFHYVEISVIVVEAVTN